MAEDRNVIDEDIVRQVLLGDVDLFRIIVERYQKKVFNIGMMFLKNPDDASDFTQEVFLRAYNRLDSFRGSSRFVYWLTRVAYNHGINSVKGARNAESLVESTLAGDERTPEEGHMRKEVFSSLNRAVNELPENYRVCVDLYFFYGMTYPEISRTTGFPVNTVKSHVFRAKQVLRDSLRGTVAEEYHEM